MKKIITISACLFLSVAMFGQYKGGIWTYTYDMSFGMGATGDFISPASFRGMSITGQGFVSEHISIGGQFSWQTFYEKTATVEEFDILNEDDDRITGAIAGTQYRYINSFPLLITAKYWNKNPVFETFSFFGGVGVGTTIIKRRLEVGIFALDESKWHFTVAPEVGLSAQFSESVSGFLSAQYFYSLKTSETPEHTHLTLHVGLASTF